MLVHAVWIGDVTQGVHGAISRLEASCGRAITLHTGPELVPEAWMPAYETMCPHPQMKADIVRLAALREYGGMYFDLDVGLRATPERIAENMPGEFCAVRAIPQFFIGGDLLRCSAGWGKWHLVDEYVQSCLRDGRVTYGLFSHALFVHLLRLGACNAVTNSQLFPYRQVDYTAASLVCRGFECPPLENPFP